MATVVQYKVGTGSGTSFGLTLDAPATVGNDVILLLLNDSDFPSAILFGGNSMGSNLAPFLFGLNGFYRYRVTSGTPTTLAVTQAGPTNSKGILIEVSGLENAGAVDYTTAGGQVVASGEGTATSHTYEYSNVGSNRFGLFLSMNGGSSGVQTGANGATALQILEGGGGTFSLVYKDALASGAGTVDVTIGVARPMEYFGITLPNAVGGGGTPTITNADDELFRNGETAIPITGTNFGASQGTGKVYLSPTDNVADGSRVEQTVTSWGNTSIAFTCVKGSLATDTNLYLFVVNNDSQSNAAGYVVQIQAQPTVTETLIGETGATVNSETGMTMVVWHSVPTTVAPNPAQVIQNVSSNGAGQISVPINRGALALNAPVWIALMKDGSPAKGTLRKVTPVYA